MRRKHAKKSKIVLRCALVAVFALVAATEGMSQDAGPWSVIYEGFGNEGMRTGDAESEATTNSGYDDIDDSGIPVDGGLSLLLAAGAAFGASRLRARK
jgi:hypothetical protein